MLRRHASYVVAIVLIMLVAGACLVRTHSHSAPRRGQPVYVEKHKPQKHQKAKKAKPVKHRKHRH